jgi:hypothetical protein
MSSCSKVGGFFLALVSMTSAIGAADRVPPPPRITVAPPKPPVVSRPNVPSARIPTKPPSGGEAGRGALPVRIPTRQPERVPLPGSAAKIPARAAPKAPEAGSRKTEPSSALTMSGGGGLEGPAVAGGGGLSSLPTAGGGGLDGQVLVQTGR